MDLSLTTTYPQQDAVAIAVAGEVDISCAQELRDELDRVLAEGALGITLDISDMSYIDSTGIGVLVGFAHRAQEAGAEFCVNSPTRNVARVFSLLGVDEQLGLTSEPHDMDTRD